VPGIKDISLYTTVTQESLKILKKREILYAQSKIALAPNNECSWNYMIGMTKGQKIIDFEEIVSYCREKESAWLFCANLLGVLVDIEEQQGNYAKAEEICKKLRDSVDDIHKKYWNYRLQIIPK